MSFIIQLREYNFNKKRKLFPTIAIARRRERARRVEIVEKINT
jgi:hypothetical protein